MLRATPRVVGQLVTASWQFELRVLWGYGFRVGDLLDFTGDDDRHIHPVWSDRDRRRATLVIPPTQKYGHHQETHASEPAEISPVGAAVAAVGLGGESQTD